MSILFQNFSFSVKFAKHFINPARSIAYAESVARPAKNVPVTLIPGDGVYPDLIEQVKHVFTSTEIPVDFSEALISEINPENKLSASEVVASINQNRVCLKGIIATPSGQEFTSSVNMTIRSSLNMFANVVRVKSIPGISTRHNNLDFVVIREQTEGEYAALEHESVPGVVECLKIITRDKSANIAKFAFDFALRNGRKKVTAIHKANIMKLADGLFLETCRQVAQLYPQIKFENMIIDNCCMQLVSNPYQFDVMVMPNLYGSIVDNLATGLMGGAGVVPGESYGHEVAVFEPAARHTYSKAAGKDIANPMAMLLSAVGLLKHVNLPVYARNLENAIFKVIRVGRVRTRDLGGTATTSQFTQAVIDVMQRAPHI